LNLVDDEPAAANLPVTLGPSHRKLIAAFVPGFGFDCFENWLEPPNTVAAHLHDYGYGSLLIGVEGLSGTQRNARLIRDALMALPADSGAARIVLIGYSKGASDVLDAIATYPELHSRLAAVVSIAGTIGGSPLANGIEQELAERLRYFPGAECKQNDHGAIASLRPATRKNWLASHSLPQQFPYYSLVTLPQRERISMLLQRSYGKLARIDARNDSQVIFYDQVIPGSTLVGYLNADHWAVAMPIARRHVIISTLFVTQSEFPREALAEALLRFIEEDLDERQLQTAN
jgi:dienelactone hydrolase